MYADERRCAPGVCPHACAETGFGTEKVDLHTHTWFSDGTLSPTRLVQMAAEKGIELLAITDHDGVSGLAEGREAACACGIRFLPGIEFSAQLSMTRSAVAAEDAADAATADGVAEEHLNRNIYMHLLGYGFDPQNAALLECMAELRQNRAERNDAMRSALLELGFPLRKEDIEVYPGQPYIGKPNFARALVRAGYASSIEEAFSSDRMMAAPTVRAVHRKKIDAGRAISLIRGAGGFVSLAHPCKISRCGSWKEDPKQFMRSLEQVVARLSEMGLSGMECRYSSHTEQQENALCALAEKYGLTVTAGSDYHGPGIKKNVELGQLRAEQKI